MTEERDNCGDIALALHRLGSRLRYVGSSGATDQEIAECCGDLVGVPLLPELADFSEFRKAFVEATKHNVLAGIQTDFEQERIRQRTYQQWLWSSNFDPKAISGLCWSFDFLFRHFAAPPVDIREMFRVFDAVEYLPLEMLRGGPAFVHEWLPDAYGRDPDDATLRTFAELFRARVIDTK